MSDTQPIEIPKAFLNFESKESDDKKSLMVKLKQLQMMEQAQLVKGIGEVSKESEKMIEDIVQIESDIEGYQGQIDSWIKKIQDLNNTVTKIKSSQLSFQQKCENLTRLRDHLVAEKKKR